MNTHTSAPWSLPLEEPTPDGRTFLNASVWFVDSDGYRVVFRWHEPIYRVALADEVHLRLVAVTLRQSRLATQEEICQAFGHDVSTQRRWERQYHKHGIDGLVDKKPTGRRRELDKSQEGFVRKWFRGGWSNRQMAKRLAVDEATIRRTLKRLGLVRKPATLPRMLPEVEDQAPGGVRAEAIAWAPAAGVERIGNAPTETPSAAVVPSSPSPEPCGQEARVSIEPPAVSAFTLDHDPSDRSGDRLLARAGLLEDAVPLFADHPSLPRAGALLAVPLLVRRRIATDEDRVAFLYVDGHVREYHGKFPLFEAKKAQRQVVAPAATDTWVHDADGEPLLVVTSEVNAKLTQVLEPILADVRRLVGDGRRMTVIFDRGGFSPKLFARLLASGFDLVTYRKGKARKLPAEQFATQRRKIDGAWREYEVCDRPRVRVGTLPAEGNGKPKKAQGKKRYLWMREVRVLREDGRQTPILTNREDLSAVMVAYRIFHRWRQENYFKSMDEEFALDALVEYGAEEVSEATDRRNPQWLRLTRRLKEAREEVARLQSEPGKQAAANHEATRPTMRGFKIAHAELREQLQKAETQIERLLQQRKKTPKRIPASDLMTLKTEKKLIADAIKMAAYQVETELLGMLRDHYPRADEEGRTLLHAAFQSPARLEVAEGELRVTIGRQSSPHRTAALEALCEQLDALAIPFPGTHLRLRLAVQAEKPIMS